MKLPLSSLLRGVASAVALLTLGLASINCSSSAAGSEVDEGDVTSGHGFKGICTDLWTKRCADWKQCLPNDFKALFTSESDCVAQRAQRCETQYSGAAVSATPADVKPCFAADEKISCSDLTRILYDANADGNTTNADPACAKIPGGTLKDGASCAFNAECSGGACIRSGECGTCATKQPEGGDCKVNEHCKAGLSCGSQGKCTKVMDKGGDCTVADCHTDLLCGDDGKCGDRIADGAPCDPANTSIKCNWAAGSLCNADTKTCQPHEVGGAGDSCLLTVSGTALKFSFRDLCAPGLHCAQDSQRAVCVPTTKVGEGCFFSHGVDGSQCGPGAKCVSPGVCVKDDAAACKDFKVKPPPTGPNPGKLPVFTSAGGPLMTDVQTVTVTFTGFPHTDHVRALGDYMFSSGWYAAAGAPYGIGKGSALPPVELSELPPNTGGTLSNLDLQDFLVKKIKDGSLPVPPPFRPDQAFMFFVYLPPTLIVSGPPYGTTCKNVSAYHDVVAAPYQFGYSLIANCPAVAGLTEEQLLDSSATHELIEGATDAINFSNAYLLPRSSPWSFTGAEVTDVCQGSYLDQNGFLLARNWSNEEAVAGHDPCVPTPADNPPYFNVVADSPVVSAAAGATATFELHGWTTGQRGDWELVLRTLNAPANFAGATVSAPTINDKGISTLSVPVPADAPKGTRIAIQIRSHGLENPTFVYHQWVVEVDVK